MLSLMPPVMALFHSQPAFGPTGQPSAANAGPAE
jgi:hypothetical protein